MKTQQEGITACSFCYLIVLINHIGCQTISSPWVPVQSFSSYSNHSLHKIERKIFTFLWFKTNKLLQLIGPTSSYQSWQIWCLEIGVRALGFRIRVTFRIFFLKRFLEEWSTPISAQFFSFSEQILPIYTYLCTVPRQKFCRNTFHSTSSTTTVKIKISCESIQKEFQIMIMKKNFGKNKKIKFVNFFDFLLIFKNV